jgi:hypothetical protein
MTVVLKRRRGEEVAVDDKCVCCLSSALARLHVGLGGRLKVEGKEDIIIRVKCLKLRVKSGK